jgi:hypothetical protein
MAFSFAHSNGLKKTLIVWALIFSLVAGLATPVRADGAASTRNIILGGLALAAGIILYNNYQHKVAQANTVVGYTNDGGVIYGDGRIVYPNSGNTVVYLSNNGAQPCTFNGYGQRCTQTHLYGYFPHGYQPACWPPGHCKQYWKEHPGNKNHENEGHGDQGHGD